MTSPAPFNVPGAAIITASFNEAGQTAQCGIGISTIDGADPTFTEATAVLAAWWTAFKSSVCSDTQITGGTMRFARLDSPVVELAAPSGAVGTYSAGTSSFAPYCGLVKWGSATGGRTGKGRTYLPGVSGFAVAPGGRAFVADYRTAVTASINAYLASAAVSGASNVVPAIVSRKANAARDITSAALAAVPGIQRRRMR